MSLLDDMLAEETWPKKCSCGELISEERWETLRYVGVQRSGMETVPDVEMRNCGRCKSTLAIVVPRDFA